MCHRSDFLSISGQISIEQAPDTKLLNERVLSELSPGLNQDFPPDAGQEMKEIIAVRGVGVIHA